MREKESMIEFQLNEMHDRLPPLSFYHRSFKLDDWQCRVMEQVEMTQPPSAPALHRLFSHRLRSNRVL